MSITFVLLARPVISTLMPRDISAKSLPRWSSPWQFTVPTDGLALGIQGEAPATDATKWSLFSALCIHKVPEGLALGSLLIGAGLRRAAAVGWVAAVEATTLLGGVIGYFFLTNISILWLGLIMAHVGGGFIYLATHAVVGEMLKHGKKLVLTSFALGVALIAVLNVGLRLLR